MAYRYLFIINRLRAIWPKGYQRGSLRKSHQNGDFLKASNRLIIKALASKRQNITTKLLLTTVLIHYTFVEIVKSCFDGKSAKQ